MGDSFDRVRVALRGGKPDRVPISLWGHMYYKYGDVTFREASRDPEKLTKAHVAFSERFGVDFLKMMPDGMYMAESWGTGLRWDEESANAYAQEFGVRKADEWSKLEVLDPSRDRILSDQLKAVRLLFNELEGRIPFIQTIFSPISWAMKIAGSEQVLRDMRQNPDVLKQGLDTIAESVLTFGQECLDRGVTGFFYAIQNSSTHMMTDAEYEEFNVRYDMKILKAFSKAEFLMLHPCTRTKGDEFYVDKIAEYPVHAINWWDRGSPFTLSKARETYGSKFCLIGGLDNKETLLKGTIQQVEKEAMEAIESVGKSGGFMLGPGCTVSHKTPDENLHAAVATASKYS
jgi:uroporphyrinogen decarboxylase